MKCDNCGEETTGEDQNPVREMWVCNDCVEECQERVVLGL
jgi:formylmethanofuran dehydrogenase subunit E